MTVTLPADLEASIRAKVASGRYDDESAVIRDALNALNAQEHAQFLRLRDLVRAGFESGDERELTSELWDEINREVDEAFLRGDVPDPDVCP